MKKIIYSVFALAALAVSASCSKDGSSGSSNSPESFAKAEIKVEVTANPGDETFGDYFSLEVNYWDFAVNNEPESPWTQPGTMKTATVTPANPTFVISTTSKPVDGRDYVADMILKPVYAEKLPETLKADLNITVKGLIYGKSGNIIREVQILDSSYSGQPDAERFRKSFDNPLVRGRYSLCYVQGLEGWFYNFGIERLPN